MGFQFISNFAPLRRLRLHNHGIQVHLQRHMITASKLVQSCPPMLHDHCLQVYFQSHLNQAPIVPQSSTRRASPHLLDYYPSVHLCVHSIIAFKCILKYAWLPPVSACSNLFNHGLKVYLRVYSVVLCRSSFAFSQALTATSSDIPCVEWQWLGSIYRYIDGNTKWIHEFE
jgi:hypothetical protein